MPRKPSCRWSAREQCWRSDAGGATWRLYLPREADAQAHAAFAEHLAGLEAQRASEGPTLAELAQAFLDADRGVGLRTLQGHKESLERWLGLDPDGRGLLQDRPAKALDEDLTARCLAALARQGVGPKYRRNSLAVVKALWRWAASADGGRAVEGDGPTPVRPPKLPAKRPKRVDPATVAAVVRRARATGQRGLAWAVLFGYRTGARPGEVAALRWEHWQPGERRWELWAWKNAGKTGKPRLIRVRRRWPARFARWMAAGALPFLPRAGRGWTVGILGQAFARVRDAVWTEKAGRPEFTLYSLRHEHISRALERGESPATLAELCGTSIVMIDRVYGHLGARHLDAAADRIWGRG